MNIKSVYYTLERYLFGQTQENVNRPETITNRLLLSSFIGITLLQFVALPYYLFFSEERVANPFYLFAICQAIVFVVIEEKVWLRKANLKLMLCILLSFVFARQITEIVLCTFYIKNGVFSQIIAENCLMSMALLLFAVLSGLRMMALIQSFVMLLCFVICVLIFGQCPSHYSCYTVGVVYLTIFTVAVFSKHPYIVLQDSDKTNQPEEKKTSGNETKKVVEMLSSTPDMDVTKVHSLIDRLDETQQSQIIENVTNYLNQKTVLVQQIEAKWPELTNTEIEICILIYKGKALKEICSELDKSETTVSSHRSHIRQKLGLERNDNLQRFLQNNLR